MNRRPIGELSEVFVWIACLACGLILPLLLAVIGISPRYAVIIEECAKAAVLLGISFWADKKQMPYLGILVGLSFGISESFLYVGNYIFAQNIGYFFARLFLTVPMHALSGFLLGWSLSFKQRYLLIGGLAAAIVIHLAFNHFVF